MQNQYSDLKNKRNKVLSRTAEKAAGKAVLIGADIIRAVFTFLKRMLFSFLGK